VGKGGTGTPGEAGWVAIGRYLYFWSILLNCSLCPRTIYLGINRQFTLYMNTYVDESAMLAFLLSHNYYTDHQFPHVVSHKCRHSLCPRPALAIFRRGSTKIKIINRIACAQDAPLSLNQPSHQRGIQQERHKNNVMHMLKMRKKKDSR
jgi:hypothetical protein